MVVSCCELCGRVEERSGGREVTGELACSFSVWVSLVAMALNDFRNAVEKGKSH